MTKEQTTSIGSQLLPDGSVMCANNASQILTPAELWRALVIRNDSVRLLGKSDDNGGPRTVYYRFSNRSDWAVQEPSRAAAEAAAKGLPPIRDLSDDAGFQADMRRAMDEVERIGHIRFLPAEQGSGRVDLSIGYANRWSHELLEAGKKALGHATYPTYAGTAVLTVLDTPNRLRTARHELGHALSLSHPSNYPNNPQDVVCDVGPRHDIRQRTVMSYKSYIEHYAEDDVLAIQHLYGKSKLADAYRVPALLQAVTLAAPKTTRPGAPVQARIDYHPTKEIAVEVNGARYRAPSENASVLAIESSPRDEKVEVTNPPKRLRYVYRGGADTLRVEATDRIIGVVNTVATPADMRVEASSGNLILQTGNDENSMQAGGKLTVKLLDAAREAVQQIAVANTPVASGLTGFEMPAVRYDLTVGSKKTSIVLARGMELRLEDAAGAAFTLPPLPAPAAAVPAR